MTFQLDTCAAEALIGDTIVCREYNVRVPLRHLVPDLLLTDLPSDFQIDQSQLEYNPKDPAARLGRGGAGGRSLLLCIFASFTKKIFGSWRPILIHKTTKNDEPLKSKIWQW